jgi:hypothetical protein
VLNRAVIGVAPAVQGGWARTKIVGGNHRLNWTGTVPLDQEDDQVKPYKATVLTVRLRLLSHAGGLVRISMHEQVARHSDARTVAVVEAEIDPAPDFRIAHTVFCQDQLDIS